MNEFVREMLQINDPEYIIFDRGYRVAISRHLGRMFGRPDIVIIERGTGRVSAFEVWSPGTQATSGPQNELRRRLAEAQRLLPPQFRGSFAVLPPR
jgi:hypothetical protein